MNLNLQATKQTWTLPWEAGWVTAVAFLGNGRRLAAGNQHGQIFLWDLPEKLEDPAPAPLRRLDGHTNLISRLVATPDGKRLVSTSYDRTTRVWDLEAKPTGTDTVILDEEARTQAAKKAGKPVDKTGVQVEVQPAAKVIDAFKDWIRCLAILPDGNQFLTGDDTGNLIVWDTAEGKEVRRWKVPGWVTTLSLSADGKLAVTGESSTSYSKLPVAVRLWDAATGEPKLDLTKDFKLNLGAAAFTPDGKQLFLGQGYNEGAGKLYLVDPADGKKLKELGSHQYGVTALLPHPSGEFMASAGRDTLVKMWQLSDSKMVKEIGQVRGGQFKDWIHSVAFSADGLLLAAADMAGRINVWTLG